MILRHTPTERHLTTLLTKEGIQKYRANPLSYDIAQLNQMIPGLEQALVDAVKYNEDNQLAATELLDTIFDNFSFEYGEFLHGRCHILAITLHQEYGLSLEAALEYDFDIDDLALQHAWVRYSNEYIIDAAGFRKFDHMVTSFGGMKDISGFTAKELYAYGGRSNPEEKKLAKQIARKLILLANIAVNNDCAQHNAPTM